MTTIGFFICGIGNGHITQAETVYKILLSYNYKIPVIIIYGDVKRDSITDLFGNSVAIKG